MTLEKPSATTSRDKSATLPRQRLGFAAATVSLVAVFAASGAPIPLYERYRTAVALTTGDLSIAAVAYFVAVMITLVLLGRLSDHIGRRIITLTAVLLAAAGSLALLDVTGLGTLVAGRALQGAACGLASSGMAAYAIDLAPDRPRWLAATVVAAAPLVGLTLGSVGSGALAEYAPAPEQTPYLTVLLALILCAVLVLLSPEPVARSTGALASLYPRVHIPHAIRPLLPASIAVFVATWALGGFYQAFSPTISAQSFDTTNTLVAGIVFASFMAPYAFGGLLTGRLTPVGAQRAGILVFSVAVAGVVIGLRTGTVLTMIVCGMVAGAAQGAAFTGSMRRLLPRTSADERAGLMATVYLFSYGGAAVPSLVSGRLTASGVSLETISLGYAALAIIGAATVLMSSRRTRSRVQHHEETDRDR
ncbi:MFS transporter [Tsukamurella sp. PLM1]|uniref:MFS transporter n=1 Tax=Tsukamurella sp. PLM1 TaxID=2929795 RepID=UPI00205891D8|nr:MFS transporter [Tsukamurella sp. PLM1]BDH56507.1 MFS transporter [Tsukamurella sp. PLM1]